MKKYAIVLLLVGTRTFGQNYHATEGANLLFQQVKTKLTTGEKEKIFLLTGLKLTASKKGFSDADYEVDVSVFPTDLNADGREDIFVVENSTALFGNTGMATLLFLKNKKGEFQKEEGVSGSGSIIITGMKNIGFPQLIIGGLGFTFPVYKWNGVKYVLLKKISDGELQGMKTLDVQEASKAYTSKW